MIWNTSELSASHLSRATAIFVVDCCQFGPIWIVRWKWSLWPVPAWLAVQRSKAIYFLTLYDSINDMKYFQTISITPQPWHIQFCCWLLPIWPYLDCSAEIRSYGMCRLGWQYNGVKLSFYSSYIRVSMIWNNSELPALHLYRATVIFVVDCFQFGHSWIVWMKTDLMACADLVGGTTEQGCLFPDPIW